MRIRAGKGSFVPGGHKLKEKVTSWVERIKQADNPAKGISEDTGNEIICSEYATKITVLTLDRLNKKLANKMNDAGEKVPEKGIMTMPFNKKEDLSKMTPSGIIKGLGKAVEKVENILIKSAVKR